MSHDYLGYSLMEVAEMYIRGVMTMKEWYGRVELHSEICDRIGIDRSASKEITDNLDKEIGLTLGVECIPENSRKFAIKLINKLKEKKQTWDNQKTK